MAPLETTPKPVDKPPSKKPIDWLKIGSIAGIIAVIVAIIVPSYLYWIQRNNKSLSYGLISQGPLVSVNDDLKGRLKVLLDGKPIGSVNLIVLKLENTGNVAIRKADYDKPLSINFGSGSQVLGGEIVWARPNNLGETLKVSPQEIVLNPVLLNKGDGLVIKALVNSPAPSVSLDGRIADVDEIKKVEIVVPQQGRSVWNDAFLMLVLVISIFAATFSIWVSARIRRQTRQIDDIDTKIKNIGTKRDA